MSTGIYIFLALMIGVISAIYLPMNSSVSRYIGSPLTATITFYTVALVTTVFFFFFIGDAATLKNIGSVTIPLTFKVSFTQHSIGRNIFWINVQYMSAVSDSFFRLFLLDYGFDFVDVGS